MYVCRHAVTVCMYACVHACMYALHACTKICMYMHGFTLVRVRGSPERDILSLRTLGLGLDRFGEFFRRRRGPIFGKSGT